MLTEGLMLSLGLCAVLSLLGFRFKSRPLLVVSSLGLVIIAFDVFGRDGEFLNLALFITIAFAQVLLARWSD